jgi:hypothetical protein
MHGEFLGPVVSRTPAQRSIRASNNHDIVIIARRFDFCNAPALSESRPDFSLDFLPA